MMNGPNWRDPMDVTQTHPYNLPPVPPLRQMRPRRRRFRGFVVLLALLVAVVGGYFTYQVLLTSPDYEGEGTGSVVIEVPQGATTTQIGRVLADNGVVAAVESFIEAAEDEPRIRSVQPGFYQMRQRMSAASAVARLLDPAARVGQLEIRGGSQLYDTIAGDGSRVPGVLSLIARASCVTVGGQENCLSVDELQTAMETTDPAELGVPEWALERVAAVDPHRRLEGLIVPGLYNVRPQAPAAEVLRELLARSGELIESAGLVSGARAIGADPYDVLIIASLVEKEGIVPDMPRVARVIYNRLGVGQRLELDSTVNYPLERQTLLTSPEDRARVGPYNSYAVPGLPPTPISAPGREAIAAALEPEEGPWFYFVRCRTDGSSCFAVSHEEHLANVRQARANGAI